MAYFILALLILIVGYPILSKMSAKLFGADNAIVTPAIRLADGVDFVELPRWRIFLIQFLNIAGLGPIYGAIAGALFGPVAFLWIVLGGLFIGGMHDYLSGMISLRNDGATFAEVAGRYLGKPVLIFIRLFTLILLILLTVVFIKGPSTILALKLEHVPVLSSIYFWLGLIFIYVAAATVFPIDKIVGRVTPIMGIAFITMPLALLFVLIFQGKAQLLPPFTLENLHYNPRAAIWPMLFVTIACGAVSGFHATQSPLMARCLNRESDARHIFYGAMVAESIVALIWAAVAMTFTGSMGGFSQIMQESGGNASKIVMLASESWLGTFGIILAVLSVVIAPITSADTALRSARLTLSEVFHLPQHKVKNRLMLALPLFAIVLILTKIDFDVIWRYFAFSNQLLAALTLWTIASYFKQQRGVIAWWPIAGAMFMTSVVSSYILYAPEGFQQSLLLSTIVGITMMIIATIFFFTRIKTKNSLA